jgi:hypothetical protein
VPINILAMEISLAIPLRANRHIPTGGVRSAKFIIITTTHGNQIGFIPRAVAIGYTTGTPIRSKGRRSIAKPRTKKAKRTSKIKATGDKPARGISSVAMPERLHHAINRVNIMAPPSQGVYIPKYIPPIAAMPPSSKLAPWGMMSIVDTKPFHVANNPA